jgi:hypothetical protein
MFSSNIRPKLVLIKLLERNIIVNKNIVTNCDDLVTMGAEEGSPPHTEPE